jgi:hypothetical protein
MFSSVVSSVVNGVIGKPAHSPSISMLKFSSDIADLVGFFVISCQRDVNARSAVRRMIYQCQYRVGLLRSGGSLEAYEYVSWDCDNDIRH